MTARCGSDDEMGVGGIGCCGVEGVHTFGCPCQCGNVGGGRRGWLDDRCACCVCIGTEGRAVLCGLSVVRGRRLSPLVLVMAVVVV